VYACNRHLWNKFLSALISAAAQNISSAGGFHLCPEPFMLLVSSYIWIKSWFHRVEILLIFFTLSIENIQLIQNIHRAPFSFVCSAAADVTGKIFTVLENHFLTTGLFV